MNQTDEIAALKTALSAQEERMANLERMLVQTRRVLAADVAIRERFPKQSKMGGPVPITEVLGPGIRNTIGWVESLHSFDGDLATYITAIDTAEDEDTILAYIQQAQRRLSEREVSALMTYRDLLQSIRRGIPAGVRP